MTEDEKTAIAGLEQILDLTDKADWPLVHMTVRDDVQSGKYSSELEKAYKALVDKKLSEQ